MNVVVVLAASGHDNAAGIVLPEKVAPTGAMTAVILRRLTGATAAARRRT
ncbi:hypothetical protein ACQEU8_04325 [Streptomyces sp. CA-250714]